MIATNTTRCPVVLTKSSVLRCGRRDYYSAFSSKRTLVVKKKKLLTFSSSSSSSSSDVVRALSDSSDSSSSSERGGKTQEAAVLQKLVVNVVTVGALCSIAPSSFSPPAFALEVEMSSVSGGGSALTTPTTAEEEAPPPPGGAASLEAPPTSEPTKPAFTLNMDLDTSAYDQMTRTGGNSEKAKALVNKGVPSAKKDQGGGFNLIPKPKEEKKKVEKAPKEKKAEKPKKTPTPKMASPLESKGAKEEDGFNPIVIVAPLALGGFAFGASKLIGGPLVERKEEEEEQPRTQIMKKPKKVVEAPPPPAFTPPKIEVPKIETPKIEVPELPNPFASMGGGGDPLPPDQPRKSFPKRSEASFNFAEEDESNSSGEIDDALDESYEEDRKATEREMEREMREAEREQKRAEAKARREEKKLEAAQRREEQRAEQEEKKRQQDMIHEQKQAEAAERKEEQARTRAMKAEEAAELRAQRRAEAEAKAAAAKEARTQKKSVSVKVSASESGEGGNFLTALTEMRKPAATQALPAQTVQMQRKVKTFSNKSKSMAKKPSLALTQKVRPPNAVGGLPQGFPSVEDFEGLTQDEKLELCDEADAIVTRLETRADAAEKFINSPVTSLLFFLKPGAEKNAIKARSQAEEAAAAARSLRTAASNPLGGAGAAAAAVVGILGAGALLFGVLSSGGGNGGNGAPSPSSNVTAKAPSPQTEQVRDIEAAEKMEAVKSGEASAEDVYAMFTM
ncbi:unnamed protein product [Bathycoccus prasinos]